jgi:ABC-type sugar transport system substrate-binding protein
VYLVPAYNSGFLAALERYDYRRTITVVHDVNEQAIASLDSGLLTAVVYQDPVLQGYRAVRTLETSLESKYRERLRDIEIAHTLVFRENVNFLRNHYWMPEAAE